MPHDPTLYNKDLAPIPQDRRTWGLYNYVSLWVAMSVCIPTYMLASGLIAGGMSWREAIGTILLGNLIVLVPMLLNGHAGAKYGIPFPVLVRASFGVRGANLPAVLRALVACGWFGIQTWIGGTAIYSMLKIVWPGAAQMAGGVWLCFFAFWLLNIAVIWRGIETIKFLEGVGAPFMLGIGLLLLWWIARKAGGLGPVLSAPGQFHSTSEFVRFFIPSLTGMVGFWATVALNIPDFTRYAKSQKAQAIGQAMGLPAAMTLYSFIGVAVTSASVVLFGQAIWDPVALLGKFNQPVVACIALVALLVATLNTNVAANVVSPSNDFSNLNPRLISFRTGGLITGVAGVLMMPWKLLTDFSSYIFGWLVGYSGLLGPIAGVMIADYFLVRRARLEVEDLYRRGGAYELRRVRSRLCNADAARRGACLGGGRMITDAAVSSVSFYIDGAWERPAGRTLGTITNPATGSLLAEVPYAEEEDVDRAVRAAHAAFLKWRDVPVVDRVQSLYRYKALLEKHAVELAAVLTGENGKTAGDAQAEVRRAIQMVEMACGMPSLMMGDSLNDVAAGIDCKTIRQPIGVCGGITPFNFPAMVPMWMHPFAIACGNTFVLKPSEKVPLTPTYAVQLLHEAGLPAGVINLVHGAKPAVDALLRHPLVKAVSFVGSTPVARYIYATAAAEGKRVQALGGAKNHLIVMPDADMPKTVEAIIGSAFGAAGERCLAGSVLVPVGEAAGPLLDLLVARTQAMSVGDGAQAGVDMGPLVTSDHCRRVTGYVEKGVSEGAVPLVDGRQLEPAGSGCFLGPTIFDHVTPEMAIAREEIFGPVLSVMRVKTLEDAIELVNRSPFGNATAIFTASGKSAREYSSRCEVGMVGVNVGVAAPMAFFPFAGWKRSFFGDLHAHGKDAVAFYTEQKVIMSRWF